MAIDGAERDRPWTWTSFSPSTLGFPARKLSSISPSRSASVPRKAERLGEVRIQGLEGSESEVLRLEEEVLSFFEIEAQRGSLGVGELEPHVLVGDEAPVQAQSMIVAGGRPVKAERLCVAKGELGIELGRDGRHLRVGDRQRDSSSQRPVPGKLDLKPWRSPGRAGAPNLRGGLSTTGEGRGARLGAGEGATPAVKRSERAGTLRESQDRGGGAPSLFFTASGGEAEPLGGAWAEFEGASGRGDELGGRDRKM